MESVGRQDDRRRRVCGTTGPEKEKNEQNLSHRIESAVPGQASTFALNLIEKARVVLDEAFDEGDK